jgi:hypothetical protein
VLNHKCGTVAGSLEKGLSITICSALNLVFSKWEQIFKDPMTTAAAVDRLVHHSVILELNLKRSYRAEKALEQTGSNTDSEEKGGTND